MLVYIFVDKEDVLALGFGENMYLGTCPQRSENVVGRDSEVKRSAAENHQ